MWFAFTVACFSEGDCVLPSSPDGGVSDAGLFPGVDASWLVELLGSLAVSHNNFHSRRGTSS